jgi:hypothetical protein
MRKTIYWGLLLIMWCTVVVGQTEKDKPSLLARLDPRGEDVLNEIYKLGLVVKSDFDLKEDTIAVRVCSDDPLPVALSMAKGLPFVTTVKLEKLGIPKSRIYYLRQSRGCRLWPNNYALTEYWLIPRNAEFPEFDQAVGASCLSGYQLTNADSLTKEEWFEVDTLEQVTPQSYALVLDKVLKQLKQNKSAVTIVRVPYYRLSPTVELKTRLRQTLHYLKVNGISNHRVYVRRIYSGSRPPFHSDEPKYPDIFLVSEN